MVSYRTRVFYNGVRDWLLGGVRTWGRTFVEATAALVTLLVSDNLLVFTTEPYYQPITYTVGGVVALVAILSRKKKWGVPFRKMISQTSSWILGVMAILLLGFAEKVVYLFDGVRLSNYNLMVALAAFLLIILPTPLFRLSDLARDKRTRSKRVPTIFDPRFLVEDRRLRLRIWRVLSE